jgi:hypothetical protein
MPLVGSSSNQRNTGRGGYHPGITPFDVDPVTWSTGAPLVTPVNGLQLYINLSRDTWTTITNLPSYLLGNNVLMTTVINESDTTSATLAAPCRIYQLRDPAWNATDITGWTLQESGRAMTMSNVNIYYKDFTAGAWTLDNNSAMYFFVFPYSVSTPSGSLGKDLVGGTGDTIANTSSNPISAYRQTLDPFNMGAVVYSISSGALPTGFTLNSSTGLISGSYTPSGVNNDGQVYNFTVRATDASTGTKQYADRSYSITLSVPWLYRQIITTMYMAGGYKDASVWSNANKFPRSTETCTNLGDGCIDGYNYKSGMCSDTKGYIFGGPGAHGTASNVNSAFNLRTEVKATNPGTIAFNCGNTGTTFAPDRNRSFTTGEGVSNMFRFTASTEAYATLGGGQGGSTCAVSGENKGIYWGDANRSINFSTEAQASITMAGGAHGQQKGLSSKIGYGYGGNEGTYNGGYNWRKINITNETYGTITKAIGNSGEENYAMSQDRGYILGEYDGAQNNNCGRVIYATDAAASLSTTVQGHGGSSSGHCFWRD